MSFCYLLSVTKVRRKIVIKGNFAVKVFQIRNSGSWFLVVDLRKGESLGVRCFILVGCLVIDVLFWLLVGTLDFSDLRVSSTEEHSYIFLYRTDFKMSVSSLIQSNEAKFCDKWMPVFKQKTLWILQFICQFVVDSVVCKLSCADLSRLSYEISNFLHPPPRTNP